jgi:AraC-like DNA-binding protein
MAAYDPHSRKSIRSRQAPERYDCGVSVRREIDAILASANEAPTLANVAARLSLNVRTLQRCLSDEGWVFRDLLRECRHRRAVEALAAGQLSIAAIAKQLGYSDSAHFARAFRAWTGHTPSSHEKEANKRTRR